MMSSVLSRRFCTTAASEISAWRVNTDHITRPTLSRDYDWRRFHNHGNPVAMETWVPMHLFQVTMQPLPYTGEGLCSASQHFETAEGFHRTAIHKFSHCYTGTLPAREFTPIACYAGHPTFLSLVYEKMFQGMPVTSSKYEPFDEPLDQVPQESDLDKVRRVIEGRLKHLVQAEFLARGVGLDPKCVDFPTPELQVLAALVYFPVTCYEHTGGPTQVVSAVDLTEFDTHLKSTHVTVAP